MSLNKTKPIQRSHSLRELLQLLTSGFLSQSYWNVQPNTHATKDKLIERQEMKC